MKRNAFNIAVLCVVTAAVVAIILLKAINPKEEVVMPQKGEITVVYVGGTLCKPCELLKPVYAKMSEDFKSRATFLHMLLNNENKSAYKIDLIPTIMVFDKYANEITRRILSEEEVPGVPEWIDGELKKLESSK
jgi:thiol-disulfide isomerase/thioredoxin